MKQPLFRWGRMSRRQKKVLTWWTKKSKYADYNGIICDGAIRSGKTVSMAFSFVLWAMNTFERENFAMCGKTIASFRRNVLGTLKSQLRARGYTVTEKRTENLIVISKGNKANLFYIFGGKDESSQNLIQGMTLAGVLLDEVALMPESFVNQATARCSVDGSKFWFNCNPEGPQHWFYVNWIRKCRKRKLFYLHFTMEDNLTLSEKIKERYRSQYVGVFYDRFIRGLWVIASGLIYPYFDIKKCCGGDVEGDEYYISVDYGTMNPCSMGLWAVDYENETATRIKEFYYDGRKKGRQLTDSEYYEHLEELAGDLDIECVIVDPSAASFIAEIRKNAVFNVRKGNNDVVDGIRLTGKFLNNGNLRIATCCKNSIKEFQSYSWDESSGEDKPRKENDHAMDDIRYFCNTILKHLEW